MATSLATLLYQTGVIAVTSGSTTVNGIGTNFPTDGSLNGWQFVNPYGGSLTVLSVTNATQLLVLSAPIASGNQPLSTSISFGDLSFPGTIGSITALAGGRSLLTIAGNGAAQLQSGWGPIQILIPGFGFVLGDVAGANAVTLRSDLSAFRVQSWPITLRPV